MTTGELTFTVLADQITYVDAADIKPAYSDYVSPLCQRFAHTYFPEGGAA